MATVLEHYERHLAPIYVWMSGGVASALKAGRDDIDGLGLALAPGSAVLDLGAGFGMHAIPLARLGAEVTAIDCCGELLKTLGELSGDLPIRCVQDDLLNANRHLERPPELILCMGDTITHLPTPDAVDALLQMAAKLLADRGTLVITLRDYSTPLSGERRFIPVRSDDSRILTCFLEYEPDRVTVHDLIHERTAAGWELRTSSYRKLRLSPAAIAARLESLRFVVRSEPGPRGMVRLVASCVPAERALR